MIQELEKKEDQEKMKILLKRQKKILERYNKLILKKQSHNKIFRITSKIQILNLQKNNNLINKIIILKMNLFK